jgi:D-xylonolactonase
MIEKLEMPAKKVSSLTFGGPGLRDIYITTAGSNTRESDGELAGTLLRLSNVMQGVPEFVSRIQPLSR